MSGGQSKEYITMGFLENLESAAWNDKPENNGLALKIFSEFCCDSCSCKSESNHNQED
jgi:hypothetical protein